MIFYPSISALDHNLANQKVWIHAITDNKVVGMISLEVLSNEWLWLNDLFVDPAWRRKHIAACLISSACEDAKRYMPQLVGVSCAIFPDNHVSQNLFASCGFRHTYTYDTGSRMFSRTLGDF